MDRLAERMVGRPKTCPVCGGDGLVTAPRQDPILRGLPGAVRLPCARCKMLGWVEESEIDCEASDGW